MIRKPLDFNLLNLPSGAAGLPTIEQTPNRFLSSIPKLELEINHFENSFVPNPARIPSPPNSVPPQIPSMKVEPMHFDLTPITPSTNVPNLHHEPVYNQHLQPQFGEKRRASIAFPPSMHQNNQPFGYQDEMIKRNRSNSFGDSTHMMMDSPPMVQQKVVQQQVSAKDRDRTSFLERNRKAALKCRLKKKNYVAGLETQVEALGKENEKLQKELAQYREQLVSLKAILSCHKDCSLPADMLKDFPDLESESTTN
ncbi:hypothetical protein HK103_007146 [Boothiomyces macroporosus]|uniref:BZIP domain-containing protein n=1 Tax=Boothiomyces macroporosus TaxID=261099 RepID=A0AAD5UCX4_9FUNG|nr:hypothetical protein HK103_007146 [Boothiomyces macroporosus]